MAGSRITSNARISGCEYSGGVVSDLEQRQSDRKGNPPLFLSLSVGFVIAAILVRGR
jgi:hypothetical protein